MKELVYDNIPFLKAGGFVPHKICFPHKLCLSTYNCSSVIPNFTRHCTSDTSYQNSSSLEAQVKDGMKNRREEKQSLHLLSHMQDTFATTVQINLNIFIVIQFKAPLEFYKMLLALTT